MTHICVSKLTIFGPDNGLSPGRRQAIIWTNARILLIGPPGTNVNEISIEIHAFSFKKFHLKMSSGKWHPFCLGLNVLNDMAHGFMPLNGLVHSNSMKGRAHFTKDSWLLFLIPWTARDVVTHSKPLDCYKITAYQGMKKFCSDHFVIIWIRTNLCFPFNLNFDGC